MSRHNAWSALSSGSSHLCHMGSCKYTTELVARALTHNWSLKHPLCPTNRSHNPSCYDFLSIPSLFRQYLNCTSPTYWLLANLCFHNLVSVSQYMRHLPFHADWSVVMDRLRDIKDWVQPNDSNQCRLWRPICVGYKAPVCIEMNFNTFWVSLINYQTTPTRVSHFIISQFAIYRCSSWKVFWKHVTWVTFGICAPYIFSVKYYIPAYFGPESRWMSSENFGGLPVLLLKCFPPSHGSCSTEYSSKVD